MLNHIIAFCLRNRLIVLAATLVLVIYGGREAARLPIDVFPNLNRPTVTIMTESHGLAPEEVEVLVTFPIESAMNGAGGVGYSPSPLGPTGEVAFVFPGSGNHYVGMGRGIGVLWPEILRKMDADTLQLKTQLIPECYVPWRTSWETGWEKKETDPEA